MKIFGWLIPAYRKGTYVIISNTDCAKGKTAEFLFTYLDPAGKFKKNVYGTPKRHAQGRVVTQMKYKDAAGEVSIYYGILVKDILFAIEESRLAKA